jgi:serine/threonine-protein kinase
MRCPLCDAENDAAAEACFTCGRAFDALTHGFVLSGRYEVRRPVGAGGMGRVYEAFDRVLEEPVAIKVLRSELTGDPEIARRFLHEIKLARKISHRNVCRIHEYGEVQGIAYISMEFISGRSLREHLSGQRRNLAEAFDLCLQVGEGLKAIHEHGIVHRDLKSANIMVDARGVAKILDFGIAKQVDGTAGLTAGDRIFGTPEYMSPEQVEGGPADARSDVYALGCVVFEVFTGRPPFRGDTPYATLLKHLKEPPPLDQVVLGLPRPLIGALAKALAKNRAQRFRTAADFIAALQAARDSLSSPTLGGAMTLPPTTPRPRGHVDTVTIFRPLFRSKAARWGWAAAGAVVFALAALAGLSRGSAPTGAAVTPTAPAMSAPRSTLAAAAPPPTTLAALAAPPPSLAPSRSTTTPTRSRNEEPAPRLAPTPAASAAPPPAAIATPLPVATPRPTPVDVPIAAPPSATTPALPAGGTLALIVVPDAEVVLDGDPIGVVGRRDIPLAAGSHALQVQHPEYEPLPRRFTIRAGETLTLLLDLQEKGIRKTLKTPK